MRYFYKLLLSMLLLLTIALSVVRYYFAAFSLNSSFQREVTNALSEHQLAKYSVHTEIINIGGSISDSELSLIAENALELMDTGSGLLLCSSDTGYTYYSELSATPEFTAAEDDKISYQTLETETGKTYIAVRSCFSRSGYNLVLITEQEITEIFSESEELQTVFDQIYLIALGCSVVMAALMAYVLTRPLSKLENVSVEFSNGNYGVRADIRSRDEVGDLAVAFNDMASSVEESFTKMEETVERQKRFTSNFAHELKTPMTSIIGYADMIYQKDMPPEDVRKAAWYIMNEGMRLEALSFKLMDLIALNKNNFTLEETEISLLLEETADSVTALADKRDVEFYSHAEHGWVKLEYDLFKTLLLNLIDNALKSGGSRVVMRGENHGTDYTIEITDNGRGIPPEELNKITEEFYMVDKSRSRKEHGAGLGLSLCKRIAEIHNAALTFSSVPNCGTTVCITLKGVEDDGA